MKTVGLTILALIFAIPTYGISLVLWGFVKNYYDSFCAKRILMDAILTSYNKDGEYEIRYGVNNAALPMVFDFFGGYILTDVKSHMRGILPHPYEDTLLIVTMAQVKGNRLFINAMEWRDPESII